MSRAETASKLAELRECVARGRPYGQKDWQERTIRALGLENTVRSRGRPRKQKPPGGS